MFYLYLKKLYHIFIRNNKIIKHFSILNELCNANKINYIFIMKLKGSVALPPALVRVPRRRSPPPSLSIVSQRSDDCGHFSV